VGFLLVMLVVTFVLARHEIGMPTKGAAEGSGTPTATGATGTPSGPEITMTDNKFDTTAITVAASTDISIPLTNNGGAIHNVHISDASGNYTGAFCSSAGPDPCSNPKSLSGGATGTLDFNLPAGSYKYRCDFHPTEMTGTLTVQ
jgi:plastocyanin